MSFTVTTTSEASPESRDRPEAYVSERPRRRLEGQGYWYPRLLEHVTWSGLGLGSG